ncbi:MAG: amidohydrolase [Bacteroidetes bacterium]|nr:amidohydrolase [Bacteroidota bacterium]
MKYALSGLFFFTISLAAQTMDFEEYDPPSSLVVPEHPTTRAKFPFIDVHNHQFSLPDQELSEITRPMDSLNMRIMVNLSGRGFKRITLKDGSTQYSLQDADYLKRSVMNIKKQAPGRIVVFSNVDFSDFGTPGWTERAVKALEVDVANGAKGLKIYKSLGFNVTDPQGNLVRVDDPRIDPVWKKCGELGIPVLIHTAEPFQFWQPKDKNNERWLELKQRPERYRDPSKVPSWEQLISEQHAVFKRHPNTIFINAHLGWMGNDLARLGQLFDECPNVYSEIGAVLAELGRQPRTARSFFIKYQDRIMFGKDSWNPSEYNVYFRVLETEDEYFDYYRKRHAFWKMYGLGLPDDVLKKVYYKNALRVIPGLDASGFPE